MPVWKDFPWGVVTAWIQDVPELKSRTVFAECRKLDPRGVAHARARPGLGGQQGMCDRSLGTFIAGARKDPPVPRSRRGETDRNAVEPCDEDLPAGRSRLDARRVLEADCVWFNLAEIGAGTPNLPGECEREHAVVFTLRCEFPIQRGRGDSPQAEPLREVLRARAPEETGIA